MYSRNVNVFIQSMNSGIENSLRSFELDTKFKLAYVTANSYSQSVMADVDVFIIDTDSITECVVPQLDLPPKVVFVATQNMKTEVFLDSLHLADSIWLNFAEAAFAKFHFAKLLSDLTLKRESFTTNSYLNVLIENVPDLIWFKNLQGIHLKVNEAFCKTVGKIKSDVEGSNHYYIWDIPKEVYERSDYVCLSTDDVIIETLQPQAFDEKVVGKTGLRQFVTYKAPLFDEHSNLVGTMGCAHDVTDFKNISTELEMILDNLPFAIVVKDNNDHVLIANERFGNLFNPSNKALLSKTYSYENYLLPSTYKYTESNEKKEIILLKNEQELVFSIQIEPLYDFFQNPLGSMYIYRDVTLERKYQHQMRELAYTDQLTGLYQRRYLYELESNLDTSKVNLLYIDLDNFKYINDTFGHLAGDRALCRFSRIIQELFDEYVVARIGGDEFVVIIDKAMSRVDLEQLAQNMIDHTTILFAQVDDYKHLSASVGVASASPENISFDILLKKADKALYEAKNIGKNCYIFYEENCNNLHTN